MKIKDIFSNWWWSPRNIGKYNPIKIVSSMGDIPDGNLSKNIYLVSRDNKNRWVVFDCPKGHGKRIEINLMQSSYPHWEITFNNKKITLYPSVAVDDPKCNCHFWIKNSVAHEAYWESHD